MNFQCCKNSEKKIEKTNQHFFVKKKNKNRKKKILKKSRKNIFNIISNIEFLKKEGVK